MKNWMSLTISLLFMASASAAPDLDNVYEEGLYYDYQAAILGISKKSINTNSGLTQKDQGLFVDALWDLTEVGNPHALKALGQMNTFHYSLTEKLRLGILGLKHNRTQALPADLVAELNNTLLNPIAETKLLYVIAAHKEDLLNAGHGDVITNARNHSQFFDVADNNISETDLTQNVVADLFYNSPNLSTYREGKYEEGIKLFMFCRTNRLYPCLMAMQDAQGETLRNSDGTLWTHPALGLSARGLPSHVRNGNTPAGIYTIDSVMPAADQRITFGRNRRMILNFIPKSDNENQIKSLLPESSHEEKWWMTSVVARDVGRNLLRIHGTGKLNQNPDSTFYPFMRTSGCVGQRENTYDGVTYRDQRILLDEIMKAMKVTPQFENETLIKGILYVIDIDDQTGAVEDRDLAYMGIE
jgi:hypothetical protein